MEESPFLFFSLGELSRDGKWSWCFNLNSRPLGAVGRICGTLDGGNSGGGLEVIAASPPAHVGDPPEHPDSGMGQVHSCHLSSSPRGIFILLQLSHAKRSWCCKQSLLLFFCPGRQMLSFKGTARFIILAEEMGRKTQSPLSHLHLSRCLLPPYLVIHLGCPGSLYLRYLGQ